MIRDVGKTMTVGLAVIFAIASGLAVGNLYWSQPLFAEIAQDFGIDVSQTGSLFTVTQVGYALGVLFILPLGDMLQRKKLVCVVMAISAVALGASSLADGFHALALSLFAVGATTVSGQILLPLAYDLSPDESRGRFTGIVSSGIMLGILLSRVVSGIVASSFGWRAIYLLAAVLNLVMVAIMLRTMPSAKKGERVPYARLMRSVVSTAWRTPTLPRILAMNGLWFLGFNLFWTAATFLLSAQPFGYSPFQIGLTSLAGVVGAAASVGVGGLMDRGLSIPATGALALLGVVAMAIAVFGGSSLIAFLVGAALLSLGSQGTSVLNQTRLVSLDADARNRLNTVFVVSNFAHAALGSVFASLLWAVGGWAAVCAGTGAAYALGIAVWLASRKTFAAYDARRAAEVKRN